VDAERRGADVEQSLLASRIADLSRRERSAGPDEAGDVEAAALREQLETTQSRLLALENERTRRPARHHRSTAAACASIQASYAFYDEAGGPLRDRPEGEPRRRRPTAAAGEDKAGRSTPSTITAPASWSTATAASSPTGTWRSRGGTRYGRSPGRPPATSRAS
jgi:hypothetical protein